MDKPTVHFRSQWPGRAPTKTGISAADFESPLAAHLRQLRDAQARALDEIERQKDTFVCSAAGMTREEVIANIRRFTMHIHPDRQVVLLDGQPLVTFTVFQDEIEVKIHTRELGREAP